MEKNCTALLKPVRWLEQIGTLFYDGFEKRKFLMHSYEIEMVGGFLKRRK